MKNTFQASSGLPRDQKHIYINILPSTPSVARARGPRTARSRPYYVQTRTDCTHAWDSYQLKEAMLLLSQGVDVTLGLATSSPRACCLAGVGEGG